MSEAKRSSIPGVPDDFPKMSVTDAHGLMVSPGTPFEIAEAEIRGVPMRIYKSAPPSLRVLFEGSRAHGTLEYLVFEDERVTYEAHYRAASHLANALVERFGIQKGDRVVLAMRNYPEWAVAFWATVVVGAVIVPLNAWGTGPELEYGLSDSGAKVAIVDQERADRLAEHLKNLDLKGLIVARVHDDIPYEAVDLKDLIGSPKTYKDLPDRPLPDVSIEPEDNATIFYTSGTTGKPKGALGTHRNIVTNLLNMGVAPVRTALRRGEIPQPPDPSAPKKGFLLSVPLFHATGCHSILVPNLVQGNKLCMMFKWEPELAMQLIERERLTAFGGVPAMVWQVLEHDRFGDYDLSSVENIGYGGAPAAPQLVEKIAKLFPHVAPSNGYGLTETSAATSQNVGEDYKLRPDSVGPAMPVCDVKIVGQNGEALPVGSVGELWIKGPNIVKGYWNKPEATAETFVDGWLKSGDIARLDEEGFIYILDRAKDMLIRGGENIYCVEVEDALYSHPDVMDAAVIGIPHHVLGEEVGAIVQVVAGSQVTQEELQRHVGERLAAFKVPVRIDIRTDPLPRNPNGKILKRQLREELVGE